MNFSFKQDDSSACFLLDFLSNPLIQVGGFLISAGAIGLITGGLGLAGIGLGFSITSSNIIAGVSASVCGVGLSLATAGFFAPSILEHCDFEFSLPQIGPDLSP